MCFASLKARRIQILVIYPLLSYACRGLDSGQEASIIRGLATNAAIQPVGLDEMEVDQVGYVIVMLHYDIMRLMRYYCFGMCFGM